MLCSDAYCSGALALFGHDMGTMVVQLEYNYDFAFAMS